MFSEGIRVQRWWDRHGAYTAAHIASKALLGKVVQDGGRREPGKLRAKPPKPFEVPPLPDIYSGAQERRNNYSSVRASLTRPFSDSGRMGCVFFFFFLLDLFLSSEYSHSTDSSSQLTASLQPKKKWGQPSLASG